ncbi:phosphotransferase family protein [Saccharomonospora azurea SZMC 14600]|uniref:phosphotransferase n=1 Tax=Saccharomonospora azurea TaxID=40988 RepID=UPI00023FF382|nr:phosphotransferase [Saccharomonospora azurea]EHK87754.1 phosphotransferase family protein [Saccharomonospora azurea SZMC 14600]
MTPISPSPRARDLNLLLGESARDLVGTVVEATAEGVADSVRPTSVTVRPSGDTLVRYAVAVRRRDATIVRETLVAATGGLVPEGAAVVAGDVDGESVEVGLWRWPHDPALPALARAVDGEGVRAVLARAGVPSARSASVAVQTYRPGRRAVLAITTGSERLFAKVVPPGELAGLRERHELLADHLPVPRLLATTDDGLALMPALRGTSGRTALRQGQPMPDAAALEALLDRLPGDLVAMGKTSDHRRRARHYGAVLALTAGDDGVRATEIADRIADADAGEYPVVAVHGDFYEHQLLLDHGTVTGLLDVDTAGPGRRIDDWANLLAHLAITDTPHARSWADHVLHHVRERVDVAHLRPRVASAVLGLATGPFRTQRSDWRERTRRRIALAEEWLTGS